MTQPSVDDAVVGAALGRGRVERDGDGGGDFQRAGRGDHVEGGAGGLEGGAGAGEQHLADRVVIAGLDDEEARAGQARRRGGFALMFGHDARERVRARTS